MGRELPPGLASLTSGSFGFELAWNIDWRCLAELVGVFFFSTFSLPLLAVELLPFDSAAMDRFEEAYLLNLKYLIIRELLF